MARRPETLERMRRRVDRLIGDFDHYVDVFDRAALFTGPSLYFHLKTIDLRGRMTASEALHSTAFLESVYATLTAWGVHHMGPRGAKMGEFAAIQASLREILVYGLEHLKERKPK
jgi:hypothetical protein